MHTKLRDGNKKPLGAAQTTTETSVKPAAVSAAGVGSLPATDGTQPASKVVAANTQHSQRSSPEQSQQDSEPKQQQTLPHLLTRPGRQQQHSSRPVSSSGAHHKDSTVNHSEVPVYLQGHHGAPKLEHKLSSSYSNLTKALESLADDLAISNSPVLAAGVAVVPPHHKPSRLSVASTASLQAPLGITTAQAAAPAPADAAANAAEVSKRGSGVCSGCGKGGWAGRSLTAMGSKWHEQCWRCAGCLQLLQGPYNTGKLDNLPYHPQCFREAFGRRCASCKGLLDGKYVDVKGKPMHAECFTCVLCQKAIVGSYNSSKEDHGHYHPQCYKQKHGKCCAACGQIADTAAITVKGLTLHSACFKCAACQQPIAGQYNTDADTLSEYHPDCYKEKFGKRCSVCTKLLEGKYCTVDGAALHSDCFKCEACKLPIEGNYSTSKEEGLHYHSQCHREAFGKRCAACSKLLEGSYTEVAGRSLHHHCHTCTACKAPIQESKFKLEGMESYHSACHRQKFDPRCEVCTELLPLVTP